MVCEVAVFEPGKGAIEDSLIGSGRTLIASNNYGYVFTPVTLVAPPTEPGIARLTSMRTGRAAIKCGRIRR